jgi:outer membrane protein assembly factor BamB
VVTFDHPRGLSLVAVAEQDGGGSGFLRGFDANTGAALWTSSVPVSGPGESCTDPIVIPHFEGGLQIQIGTFEGNIMTFNAYNGLLAWEKAITPGSALFARPHWAGW